jgi:hypothetical protein
MYTEKPREGRKKKIRGHLRANTEISIKKSYKNLVFKETIYKIL